MLRYTYTAFLVIWWHIRGVYVAMFFSYIAVNAEFLGKLVVRLLHHIEGFTKNILFFS